MSVLSIVLILCVSTIGLTNAQQKSENKTTLTPPYFNLAEGRKVYASATCGEDTEGPELYCKLVGPTNSENDVNINVIHGQHCDFCDPSRPDKQHPPEYAVNGRETWWQSPPLSRGMKYNEVNLTIDLGQEFHVAYVYVRMGNSPRPGLWILEKSSDYGKTYVPWQYFADSTSDCSAFFGEESLKPITTDDSVICTTEFSRIVPLEGGEIPISLLNNRPSANNYFNSTLLQEWTRATNVRLRLLRTKNLLGHLMSVSKQDPTVTRRYFYSIKDISIGGRCMCNGHADSCDNRDPTDPTHLVCLCRHNTCGPKCDRCCPGFEQKAWRLNKESEPFECEPCNCFNHSNECIYDEEIDKKSESLDIHGNYSGGGVCQNCRHNTEGTNCNRCKPKFYRPRGKKWDEIDVCRPCDCEVFHSTGNCEEETGRCECRKEYQEPNCDRCSFGYYNYPDCKACDCFINGTITSQCQAPDGICECMDNFGGPTCHECAEHYFGFPNCQPCECNPLGSDTKACDKTSGNCTCKNNYGGKKCEECKDGYYNYPSCTLCTCDTKGTTSEICDKINGKCICKEGYTGESCDQCDVNYYGYPDCKQCNCSTIGSSGTTCGATGKCTCLTGFAGRTCEQCSPGYYKYPECLPCDCDSHGANGISCNNDGICQCHHNFEGAKCDHCRESFYNFPACEECNCNPAGVISAFLGCGSVPKGELCQCKERVEGRICDKCKPLYWNLNVHNTGGCEECHCNIPGVLGGIAVCDSDSGQCTCKPNVVARRCTECDDGTYNLREDNLFGCTECGCDVGGSINKICHKTSGQCQCLPRITGQTCKEPIAMHYFPTLYQHQYEAEDCRTADSDVRYAYKEDDFPEYSWKGYANFSILQKEIFQDIQIYKPSLYRTVLRYVNKQKGPIQGVVKVVPDNPNDYEQQFPVTFLNTTKPEFVTITAGNAPVAFVMNPGKWTMSIQADKGLLLDYFVILPEEFYMASILNHQVMEPCVIQQDSNNMEKSENLCRQFKYPEVKKFPTSRGSGAYVDLGDGATATPSVFYNNDDHLRKLNLTNTRIPTVGSEQPEIDYNITLKKPGRYVVLVNYITPLDNMATHYLNVTTPTLEANVIEPSLEGQDQVVLYKCPYTTMCRQVVVDQNGVVKAYNTDENGLHLKFAQEGSGAAPAGSVGIHSVVAIPYDKWSLDYIQPRPICIQKDGECVKSTYPNPEESKKIRFEKNAVINEDQPKPVIKTNHGINYVYLNQTNNMIDIRSKVPNPGFYTFVIHYYQPDNPENDLDILIQNGFMYEAKLPVAHCAKIYGCRGVVTQKDDNNQFSLTENFMLTVTSPNGKPVYLDYILVVPSDLYTPRIAEEDDFSRTDEFINSCGQNHFFIDTDDKGFCRDSVFSITAGYNAGALRCQCDYAGSLSFDCDKFGGQCPCKDNVIGRDCSICKTGYYGFPDCRPCNCPQSSTCEPTTGQCICPPRVHGELCDQCVPLTYGFDEFSGCQDCKCNPLGVLNSLQCDLLTGECPCKDNIVGRKCDTCLAGYFSFPYCRRCECNIQGTTKDICDQDSSECYCKKLVTGPACDICMEGTYNLQAHNDQGCTECFCFGKTNRCYVSTFLHKTIIYSMEGWEISSVEENFESLNVTTANVTLEHPNPQGISFVLEEDDKNKTLYFKAPEDYLGKRLTAYGGFLNYTVWYTIGDGGKATLKPDIILVGANNYLTHDSYEQPPVDEEFANGVQIVESNFVLPSGAPCKREHLMTVLKDLKGIYIRANYWSVTNIARVSSVTLDDAEKGNGRDYYEIANTVEYCDCPPNYTGLSCEDCAPGYYRINTGPYGGYCVACSCNGHASECDLHTGVCINCQHNTIGDHCDQCAIGYHGNAKQGTPMDCLICACPLPRHGNNFASSCDVSSDGEKIRCTCDEGYFGARCESCASGYYGRPEVPGDYCKLCECSGNIDTNDIRSCDTTTGECLQCLNNTYGPACALCAPSFFGDAVTQKNCQQCVCDSQGTAECNSFTGECVCKMNVVGDKCDRCEENHYGYASGQGCRACECEESAVGQQCDDVTGQCRCKPGVTGRTCSKCKAGYWNLTSEGCISCGCRDEFSIGVGCNAQTGQCECLPGVTGDKCDQCPHRWAFVKEYGCHGCDSCTDDLLDFTDYLSSIIDPIQDEFQTAGTGFFQARRLAHINDTITRLKPKVEAITPEKVNFEPIRSELDTMANDANNMNRKANYSLENSKTLVKSANDQRATSMKMLDKVQEARDNVVITIDDINTMADNLEQEQSPRVDDARKAAQRHLDEIKLYNLADRETAANDALEQADDLMAELVTFKVPIDEFSDQIGQVRVSLKNFNDKLDDLANQTQFSLGKSHEAKNLYDNNGKDRLEKKLININTQTQIHQKNINESQTLNKNSTKLLNEAHDNFDEMSDQFEEVKKLADDFDQNLAENEGVLDKLDARIPNIERHADDLYSQANELGKILNETLVDSEAAVRAATAYSEIEKAVEEAQVAVDDANQKADEVNELLGNLEGTTDKSELVSMDLLGAADQQMNDIRNLDPDVLNATRKFLPIQDQHARNRETLDNLDKALKNYVSKDLDSVLLAAKKNAENAEVNAKDTLNEVERGFLKIEYNKLDSKNMSQKVFGTNQAIVQVKKELDSVNDKLPEIIAAVNNRSEPKPELKKNLESKINKLNEQIALARDLANRIGVGVVFKPSTSVELQNPDNLDELSTSTQISGYFKTPEPNGILLFLGNGNGSNVGRSKNDDYMALEIVSGYPTLTMDLGNGKEQIINNKYVADNEWYQFIIDRTGLNAKLTIKEQLSDGSENLTTSEKQLDGPLSIFNLDRNHSKLLVGSHPTEFDPPFKVRNNVFNGMVEDLVIGDKPVSLWNFKKGYDNNEGAPHRNKLLRTEPDGYRFNGNGYAILNSRPLAFSRNSDLQLDFKTFATEGLLFLYGNDKTFLSLELRNGKILYKYNLGSGTKVFHTKSTYNDGEWHHVNARRDGPSGKFIVDNEEVDDRSAAVGGYSLEHQETFLVGGYPQMHSVKDVTNVDFDGCITNLKISGRPVPLTDNIKSYGVVPGCPAKFSRVVSFYPTRPGFVKHDNITSSNNLIVNLKFKTQEKSGLIFYVTNEQQESGISLSLDEGRLKLISQKLELVTKHDKFHDNEWHVVSVTHSDRVLRLDYDDIDHEIADDPPQLYLIYGEIFIGGLPKHYVVQPGMITKYRPFSGCIAEATVNGKLLNFANATRKRGEELGKCILDKLVGSDSDIHNVPTLPPLDEYDPHATEAPEEENVQVINKNDTPSRGDGGKDDGEKDHDHVPPESDWGELTDIETTTWPTPRPHPPTTTAVPSECALPKDPALDPDVMRSGSYKYTEKGSRLEYSVPRGKVRKSFVFSLEFKTLSHNGIIFYVADATHKQYAALYLQGGYVYFTFSSLGKTATVNSTLLHADNVWHKATFRRDFGHGELDIDGEITSVQAAQNVTRLDVAQPYYIGGVPEKVYTHDSFPLKSVDQFNGCIRNFHMNDKPMENPSTHKVLPCSDNMEEGIFFTSRGGYLRLKDKFKVGYEFDVRMDLRPRASSGLIMAVHGKRDYFVLELDQGALKATVDNGKGPITAKFQPDNFQFCDGQWHTIQAVKSKSVLTVAANGIYSVPGVGDRKSASTDTIGYLFLGGHRMLQRAKGITVRVPYVGCIRNVVVNNVPITPMQHMVEGGVQLGSCPTI